MFDKLKHRWKVNAFNLVLIICTFAIGGSLCGLAGRRLMLLTGLEKGFWWVLLYIILVTLLWPFCVLLVSIPFGQWKFFTTYLSKIWFRMSGKKNSVPIAVFASGAGSNALQIIGEAEKSTAGGNAGFRVALVVCNKPGAGVLSIAEKYGIETLLIEKEPFFRGHHYLPALQQRGIAFIVLAGFLWKVPAELIRAYPNKIINIHPALLPAYGGKGMYGDKVHEAVIAAGEKESGISIHYVDDLYDHGDIIFQAKCAIGDDDTPGTLAKKIHQLEHEHYPAEITRLLKIAK